MIGLEARPRPFGEDDAARVMRMFGRLSPQSVTRRFFTMTPVLTGPFYRALTSVDHTNHEALVIGVGDEIVALASYYRSPTDPAKADFALLVEDGWQHHGLGRRLASALTKLARSRGITEFHADVLLENRPAVALIKRMGGARPSIDRDVLSYEFPLEAA